MANLSLVKQINKARILELLRREGGMSRAELARHLEMTRSTATVLSAELFEEGLIVNTGAAFVTQSTGRPGVGLQLNASGRYFIGAEVGTDKLKLVALDLMGRCTARREAPFDKDVEPVKVLNQLSALIHDFCNTELKDFSKVHGVGVTLPGTLSANGTLLIAPILGWTDVPVQAFLKDKLDVSVFVDNDANASALAELYLSNAVKSEGLFYLLLDVGVGGGLVIERQIFRGTFGAAGEIGHMRVSENGLLCSKGGRGCFEVFVGVRALLGYYADLGGSASSLETYLEALHEGEPEALEAARVWGTWLAIGVLNIANLFDPGHIVFGGPLAALYPYVEVQLREALESEKLSGGKATLSASPFGTWSSAMGGATLAYSDLFSLPTLARASFEEVVSR